jgi:hypothetical protein
MAPLVAALVLLKTALLNTPSLFAGGMTGGGVEEEEEDDEEEDVEVAAGVAAGVCGMAGAGEEEKSPLKALIEALIGENDMFIL